MDTDKLRDIHDDLADELIAETQRDGDRESELRQAWQDASDADRTAQAFDDWLEEYAAEIAAAWVATAVFVRFLEDNDLVEERYIAGPTDRDRERADDT